MHMHVRAYVRMDCPGGCASACLAVSWARVRTLVHVHAYARVYALARMCTACSKCYMHFGTGVLGTSAWEGVYVTQVCFYTNVHICDILTAGCARVCVCIYVCICVCVFQIFFLNQEYFDCVVRECMCVFVFVYL